MKESNENRQAGNTVWSCPACGYEMAADAKPDACPLCGYAEIVEVGAKVKK